MERKHANIAFGIAILAIGLNFLPIPELSEPTRWLASVLLLAVGAWIVISAIFRQPTK